MRTISAAVGARGRPRRAAPPAGMLDTATVTSAAAAASAAFVAYNCLAPKRRRALTLSSSAATLKVDLSGGSLAAFTLNEDAAAVNPLSWDCATHDGLDASDTAPRPLGHFLCCDRWGPPTPAELAEGMFYHGEAPQVEWRVSSSSSSSATMSAALPMAKMTIERRIELAAGSGAIACIRETVTNVGSLSRMWNQVQHPSLAAPFLTSATVIDCNGKRGFAQRDNTNTCVEHPDQPTFDYPATINRAGKPADVRHMTGGDDDVQSYEVDPSSGADHDDHPGKPLKSIHQTLLSATIVP